MASSSAERMRAFRARRAAGLAPGEGPPPVDEADRLAPAVESTIEALQLGGQDAAAAHAARRYAQIIDQAQDQAWALRWIGPNLLQLLVELQATPASRPVARRPERSTPNRLEQLRAARMATNHPQP